MHRLLRQQLGKRAIPPEWRELLEEIAATYQGHEQQRAELQRAVEALTALVARQGRDDGERSAAGEARRRLRQEAARRAARGRAQSPLPLLALDPSLSVKSLNRAAARLLGVGRREATGRPVFSLLEPLEPKPLAAAWLEALARGEPVAETLACTARDGRALAVEWVCLPLAGVEGLRGVRVVLRDHTARVEAQEAVREREERAGAALAGAGDATFDLSPAKGTLRLSPAFPRLLGLPEAPEAARTADWFDRVHPEDLAGLRAAIAAHLEGQTPALSCDHRLRHADGSWRWFAARGAALRDAAGAVTRLCGLLTDVSAHRQLIERMAHDSRHDPLTGLANRTLFLDLVRHSFQRTRRHRDYRFAILFIDIDGFKQVNDALGHGAGDDLLVQISRRLTSCLREGDRLARHAGDEFTMWLDDVQGSADAKRVADRVHQAMADPFEIAGTRLRSSASIGVAIASAEYAKAEDVFRDADQAMYKAKSRGPGHTVVLEEPASEPKRAQREQDESELRRAILQHELRVLYQPIVDVGTGQVHAFEALARWQHPRLGLVPPEQFLATAVETGLISSIDQWVLRTAGRQLHEWQARLPGAAGVKLSVNLSRQLLQRRDLPGMLGKLLQEAELGPGDVNLDINSNWLDVGGGVIDALTALRERGVGLHADDFGVGQAWLGQLQVDELDSVKLDKSFVAASGPERRVLRGLVAMALDLGKRVIAVGVETADQLQAARDAGCHSAQGFLFSKPVDAARAGALLREVPRA